MGTPFSGMMVTKVRRAMCADVNSNFGYRVWTSFVPVKRMMRTGVVSEKIKVK